MYTNNLFKICTNKMFNPLSSRSGLFSIFRNKSPQRRRLVENIIDNAPESVETEYNPNLQTYTKYFFRSKDVYGGDPIIKFIPKLSDTDIIKILEQMRSKLFVQLMMKYEKFEYAPVVETLPKNIYSWPETEEIMANVLLGPYIYGMSRSRKYPSLVDDIFENYEPPEGHEAAAPNIMNEIESTGGFHIEYAEDKISIVDDESGQSWFTYQYVYPNEQTIVQYLANMRHANNPTQKNSSPTKWILYHNLLKPYIYD